MYAWCHLILNSLYCCQNVGSGSSCRWSFKLKCVLFKWIWLNMTLIRCWLGDCILYLLICRCLCTVCQIMKIRVLWNVMLCRRVSSCQHFESLWCVHDQGRGVQEVEGTVMLQNVGKCSHDDTAAYSRWLESSGMLQFASDCSDDPLLYQGRPVQVYQWFEF